MSEEVQEVETPTTALTPPPEPPAETLPVVEAEAQETPPAVEGEEPKHGNTGKSPWFLGRISEESAKARQAEERAASVERELQDTKALLQRLQSTESAPQQPQVRQDDAVRRAEIQREAANLRFQEDVNDLNAAGYRQYGGDFDTKVNVVAAAIGQGQPLFDFVADVISVNKSNAHEILAELGANPEKAAMLARMTPKQRLIELSRTYMPKAETPAPAPVAPAAKQVSKAPAPPPAIQTGVTSKGIDIRSPDSDKRSDEEWSAAFDADTKNQERYLRR